MTPSSGPNEMLSRPMTRPDERSIRTQKKRPAYLRVVEPSPVAQGAQLEHLGGARRLLNVTVALIGIVLTAPLWIVIAILVKATSRGPVFYTQIRVGLDGRRAEPEPNDIRRRQDLGGKPFKIYKFRTMHVAAESLTGAVWATSNDPRVTRVGKFLRQHRLDELPQLINVVKGDMNVVGPRPERPTIFASLRETVPNYRERQRTLPGITGLAQVRQQYDSCIEDVGRKVEFDLQYIKGQSFWRDLRIMLETIPVILLRRGGW